MPILIKLCTQLISLHQLSPSRHSNNCKTSNAPQLVWGEVSQQAHVLQPCSCQLHAIDLTFATILLLLLFCMVLYMYTICMLRSLSKPCSMHACSKHVIDHRITTCGYLLELITLLPSILSQQCL